MTQIETTQPPAPQEHPMFTSIMQREASIMDACSGSVEHKAIIAATKKACQDQPKLLNATPASMLNCVMSCAMLGIIPNGLHNSAWLIPYGREAKLMIGYNGYIDLITRSSSWDSVEARLVYEGEHFEVHAGTRNEIIHIEDITKRGDVRKIIAAYAVARGPNGAIQWEVCTKQDIQKAYNASKNKSLWDGDNRPEMTKKTAVRKLAKYMVLDRLGQYGVAVVDDTHGYKHVQNVSGEPQDLEDGLRGLVTGEVIDAEPEPERDPDTGEIIPEHIGGES